MSLHVNIRSLGTSPRDWRSVFRGAHRIVLLAGVFVAALLAGGVSLRNINAQQAINAPTIPDAVLRLEDPQDVKPAVAGIAGADNAQADEILSGDYSKALLIEAEGPIFGLFHWYLNNRLDLAQRERCDLILIRLTSPGGDLEQSLQLARRLSDIDWATTIVFIPEEAISGGAVICLGCDRITMQAGAVIGDAGPVSLGMEGFEHAEEKVVSYTASVVRELANKKNRPSSVAELMVDRSLTVIPVREIATGKVAYLSEKDVDAGKAPVEKFAIGPPIPESGQNRFLTVGAVRAEELLLCEGVFSSEQELLSQLSIGILKPTRMNWVDRTVYILNRPWLTALLLIAGLLGLYLELSAPGIGVAGLTSLVCFGIFFWSHALGGTAGWLEVLLFLLGVICLAFELFVLPGFGIFGASGLVFLVLSLVMASQDFVIPELESEWTELRSNLFVVLGSVLAVLVLFLGQILLLDSIPGLNRFRLAAPLAEVPSAEGAASGTLLLQTNSPAPTVSLGMHGEAESDLRPAGKVKIDNRLIDVVTEGDYIEAGQSVEVIHIEGNRVIVRSRLNLS